MTRRALLLGARMALITMSLTAPALAQSPGASAGPMSSPVAAHAAHPAHIHDGQCPEPGDIAQPLNDVVLGADAAVGQLTGIAAEISSTNVPMALADILVGQFAINVHKSVDEMGVYIACGDIGGTMLGTADLAIGLPELNGSGDHGAALLHDNGDGSTQVTILLVEDQETAGPPNPAPSAAP